MCAPISIGALPQRVRTLAIWSSTFALSPARTALPVAKSIAGYVVAWFVLDEGEVANLAVAAGARRQGIGSALLDAAIRESTERGVTTLYLEVRESNQPARRLYASHGFEEVSRRKRYYRAPVEDALILRRTLKP